MGDPGYAARTAHKTAVYQANGLSALLLPPPDLQGNWPNRFLGDIRRIQSERLDRLEQAGWSRSMGTRRGPGMDYPF